MLIANAHLVPRWATWDEFRRLEALGLTMYGQMTAGSWIYIGTQGILQGTYETFAALARQHFGGTLAGRLVVTAGLGGMGGAQPLAATMNGGVFLGVEVDPRASSGGWRPATAIGWPSHLDEALALVEQRAPEQRGRCRWAWWATSPRCCPSWSGAACVPDVVTDQTSAHDLRAGLHPARACRWTRRRGCAQSDPERLRGGGARLDGGARAGDAGAASGRARWCSTTATTCAARWPITAAWRDAFQIPGFVPAYIRPLFCRGAGPFRWVALSGEPARHRRHRRGRAASCSRRRRACAAGSDQARDKVKFQGLPARICWLEYGERAEAGVRFNWLVKKRQGGGAARDRPRSPRHRLGGLAQPRDRGDAGRLGRHRRLAAAERAAEHRLRRQLGVAPPRRRRGHRLFASTPAWWWWPTAPATATIACSAC